MKKSNFKASGHCDPQGKDLLIAFTTKIHVILSANVSEMKYRMKKQRCSPSATAFMLGLSKANRNYAVQHSAQGLWACLLNSFSESAWIMLTNKQRFHQEQFILNEFPLLFLSDSVLSSFSSSNTSTHKEFCIIHITHLLLPSKFVCVSGNEEVVSSVVNLSCIRTAYEQKRIRHTKHGRPPII